MEIKLNQPIEVTEDQYKQFIKLFSGYIAHRKDDGKFFIKPLVFRGMKEEMEKLLEDV